MPVRSPSPPSLSLRKSFGEVSRRRLSEGQAMAAIALLACSLPLVRAADASKVDFGREILPILSHNCFGCHGPDEGARKAKLRLDTHDGLVGELDGVTIVTPGKPDKSELIARITSKDEDEVMPPADSGKQLTPQQIELFKRWIEFEFIILQIADIRIGAG